MVRKKKLEEQKNLPEPELIWKDGKPFMTDGWIDGSRFVVMEQPSSARPVEYVSKVLAENAIKQRRYLNETT